MPRLIVIRSFDVNKPGVCVCMCVLCGHLHEQVRRTHTYMRAGPQHTRSHARAHAHTHPHTHTGEDVENLKGGVAGGSILQGVLRLGDEIEVCVCTRARVCVVVHACVHVGVCGCGCVCVLMVYRVLVRKSMRTRPHQRRSLHLHVHMHSTHTHTRARARPLQVRPGIVSKKEDGNVSVHPIYSRIVSLYAEHNGN